MQPSQTFKRGADPRTMPILTVNGEDYNSILFNNEVQRRKKQQVKMQPDNLDIDEMPIRKNLFEEIKDKFLSRRNEQREKVTKAVEKNIKENKIPHQDLFKGIIEKGYESDIWADEADKCVECGACNTICPTCHCFLLYDQKSENQMARLRIWDSCMIKDFAQVAGGANPRPELWMRLRNRFEKKFDFFPKVADIYACTGCGRCIAACPAKIDIRKVLKRLVYNV